MRLLRPVIAAAVIIPLFVSQPVTHGTGLAVEIAGALAGLLGGLVGHWHWLQATVVSWAVASHVTLAAVTDGLIFMAIAMVLVRTAGLGLRAARLPAPAPAGGLDSSVMITLR